MFFSTTTSLLLLQTHVTYRQGIEMWRLGTVSTELAVRADLLVDTSTDIFASRREEYLLFGGTVAACAGVIVLAWWVLAGRDKRVASALESLALWLFSTLGQQGDGEFLLDGYKSQVGCPKDIINLQYLLSTD